MTPRDLEAAKEELQRRRRAIVEATQRADAEADALLDAGRGPEFEEEAQASQGLADLARMSDAERLEVQRIDAALERLAKGGYGICSACGEPIEPRRLKALPSAVRCAACAAALEREART